MSDAQELTPELLITAYANGYFPMAESAESSAIYWFNPDPRGIIPLEDFHIPRSLQKLLRKNPFSVTFDQAFPQVMLECAGKTRAREGSWINNALILVYCRLWEMGFAHSVECWQQEKLVGGLYGVSLGGAFFGESMFSLVPNASRVALATLLPVLRDAGYMLLDTQYLNDHLVQFSAAEIPKEAYLEKLHKALQLRPGKIKL